MLHLVVQRKTIQVQRRKNSSGCIQIINDVDCDGFDIKSDINQHRRRFVHAGYLCAMSQHLRLLIVNINQPR